MNRKLNKIVLLWLILALVLPMLAVSFTAKPVEAGCGCGGDNDIPPPPVTEPVKVDVSPGGGGDVEVDRQIPQSYPTTLAVERGKTVHLEAAPAPGYYFISWSGDLTSNDNPTEVRITTDTKITAHFFPEELISGDEMFRIVIPEGTIVLDKDGELLSSLELTTNETPLPPPPEANIVGLPYDLGPDGTTFDHLVAIICSYDPNAIPPRVAEEELVMAYYDEDVGEWLESPSVVDIVDNTVTTFADHLSTFTIIAPVPPLAPAAFTPSSLSISPLEADIGETVSISVLVTNTGEQEASYIVTLKINEMIEETREITLAGGSETVTFTTTKNEAGSYSVNVNGLYGSFEVREVLPSAGVNWTIIGPILAVIIFLIMFLVVRLVRRWTYGY